MKLLHTIALLGLAAACMSTDAAAETGSQDENASTDFEAGTTNIEHADTVNIGADQAADAADHGESEQVDTDASGDDEDDDED